MRFSDDVESIFTHKDKTSTAEVQQFVPHMEVGMDVLSPEEEHVQILQKTMHWLIERVCTCVQFNRLVSSFWGH